MLWGFCDPHLHPNCSPALIGLHNSNFPDTSPRMPAVQLRNGHPGLRGYLVSAISDVLCTAAAGRRSCRTTPSFFRQFPRTLVFGPENAVPTPGEALKTDSTRA